MALRDIANTYNELRRNTKWDSLSDPMKGAYLDDAADYIANVYNVRSELTEDEQRRLDNIIVMLASRMSENQTPVTAEPQVKRENKELSGLKKETEYFQLTGSDPYPAITAMLRPFLVVPCSPGVTIGRLSR